MLEWLYPRTVEIITSKFNGQIKLIKSRHHHALWVGGFEQSGAMVEKVWEKALAPLKNHNCRTVLVLGLGAGSVVGVIRKYFPKSKITGVEIDPAIIDLGKKYFGLGSWPNLTIKTFDLRKFLMANRKKYDLILVDAYIGPKEIVKGKLIASFQKHLSPGGEIVINSLVKNQNKIKFISA